MAARYWVATTTTNRSSTAWWSSIWPTGASWATAPSVNDDVYFSSDRVWTCTIAWASICKSMDFTWWTWYSGTLAWTSTLAVSGNITFSTSMAILTYSWTLTINATSLFTTANRILSCAVTLTWAVTLAWNLILPTKTLTYTSGNFSTAWYPVFCASFSAAGTTVRTLDISNIVFTCTSWNLASQVVLVATGSTIKCSWSFTNTWVQTYNDIEFTGATQTFNNAANDPTLQTTANTISLTYATWTQTLTITANARPSAVKFNSFVAIWTADYWKIIKSSSASAVAYLHNLWTSTCDYSYRQWIHNFWTAIEWWTMSLWCNNVEVNTTYLEEYNRYWVWWTGVASNANNTWYHRALTSWWTWLFPQPLTWWTTPYNVFFDENSWGWTITNSWSFYTKDCSFEWFTGSVIIWWNTGSQYRDIYWDCTLWFWEWGNISWYLSTSIFYMNTSGKTIRFKWKPFWALVFYVYSTGVTYCWDTPYFDNTSLKIYTSSTIFDISAYNMVGRVSSITFSSGTLKLWWWDFGTSTNSMSTNGNFYMGNAVLYCSVRTWTNGTLYRETSTIKCYGNFTGASKTYWNVELYWVTFATNTITWSNTFNTLKLANDATAQQLALTAWTTQTVSLLVSNGTSDKQKYIKSTNTTTPALLRDVSWTNVLYNTRLLYVVATWWAAWLCKDCVPETAVSGFLFLSQMDPSMLQSVV